MLQRVTIKSNQGASAKPKTKKALAEADRDDALDALRREGLKQGTRVYTMITRRSSSGMSRNVRIFIAAIVGTGEGLLDVEAQIIEVTNLVARACGLRTSKEGDIQVGGAGFDAGHHVVMNLSHALFGREQGYTLKHARM